MPFTEVCNALLITYVATEYSLDTTPTSSSSSNNINIKKGFSISSFVSARHNQAILLGVLAVNLLDRLLWAESAAAEFVKQWFERLLHAPKVIFVAIVYVVVLYIDCSRHTTSKNDKVNHNGTSLSQRSQQLTVSRFLACICVHFFKVLTFYPLLVLLISFFFMIFISLFEHLHLPLEWINWPLYYGILYGPFSLVYFQVKAKFIEEAKYYLPS